MHNASTSNNLRQPGLVAKCVSLLAMLGCLSVNALAVADFTIADVTARIKDERLTISFDMDLELSDEAEEALDRGIPLMFSINLELGRDRRMLWNERIVSWRRAIELRFHALSERYVIQETGRGEIRSFVTIAEAMREIGQGRTISIPVPALPTNPEIRYEVELRAKLDIEALPTPLRLMAYLSPGWRLSTGSRKWPVQL